MKKLRLNKKFYEINPQTRAIKWLSDFNYPKLAILVLMIILAYKIFSNPAVQAWASQLGGLGYLGMFIAGIMFSFGFTSPFAAGFFITLNPENIWLAGVIGGAGALVGDMTIFSIIRFTFMDEFRRLEKTMVIKEARDLIEKTLGHKIRVYLLYALAGIFIASPLPDEAGVTMLAGLTHIKARVLATISFALNTVGILVLLAL